MNRKAEIEKMTIAFQRAAHKALHGTREERSGRFDLSTGKRKSVQAPSLPDPPNKARRKG